MKVIRLLIYEGDIKWLEKQLGSSINDGTKSMLGGSITAVTLGELPFPYDIIERIEMTNNEKEGAQNG